MIRRATATNHPALSETEVIHAITRFQKTEPYAAAVAMPGNDGFTASISFNTVNHNSRLGLGSIELCLRAATLHFEPPTGERGWGWSGAITEMVKQFRRQETVQQTTQHRLATTQSTGGESELGGNAGVKGLGITAGVKIVHRRNDRTDRTFDDQAGMTVSRVVDTNLVNIEGVSGRFSLKLTSPTGNDLSFYNADFARLACLSAPEPSSVDLDSVGIVVQPSALKDDGEAIVHSLAIHSATGAWAPLAADRNKAVLGELVLSKFLKPIHKPVKLWPRRKHAG